MTAAELAAEWSIPHLELRMFYGTRAPKGMSAGEIAQVGKAAASFGLDVPSISPGLFKVRPADPEIEQHRGELRVQCLDMAEALGASVLVVFPWVRPEREDPEDVWPEQLVADFQQTADLAAERGITVAIENEPICYAATGQSLARLLDEIDRPNCGANWDAANHLAYRREDFRAGYEALGDRIVHVHVKDHAFDAEEKRRIVPPGEGEVDWRGLIDALIADDFGGLVVIETHFGPKVAASRACTEALLGLLADAGEAVE